MKAQKMLEPTRPRPMIGGDPELFVLSDIKGDYVAPSILLPKPKEIVYFGKEGGVNRDGMAWEFNPHPSQSPKIVANNLAVLMNKSQQILAPLSCQLAWVPGIPIQADAPYPDDVWEIGCVPDKNVYTGKQNEVSVNPREFLMRFGGGHISISVGDMKTEEDAKRLIPWLDALVGCFSTTNATEMSLERRAIYGRAGDYRWKEKNRILEYRTPDNVICHLKTDRSSRRGTQKATMFETCSELVIQAVERWRRGLELSTDMAKSIRLAINKCKVQDCEQLYKSALEIE